MVRSDRWVAGRNLHVAALRNLKKRSACSFSCSAVSGKHRRSARNPLFRLACEEYVTAAGLALAGDERFQQIFLGPCTFNALFHNLILFNVCRLFSYSKDKKNRDNSPNYPHRLFYTVIRITYRPDRASRHVFPEYGIGRRQRHRVADLGRNDPVTGHRHHTGTGSSA